MVRHGDLGRGKFAGALSVKRSHSSRLGLWGGENPFEDPSTCSVLADAPYQDQACATLWENASSLRMARDRCDLLVRFYSILGQLEREIGGVRKLADCSGLMNWPKRGVYFFQETGEVRTDTGVGPRIVRVGTHALRAGTGTKLWTRLSQHKGASSTGGGNHRGSIFRLIVGSALIRRDGLKYPTWGQGKKAQGPIRSGELALEREVSRHIADMPFLWIPVEDEAGPNSRRTYIERSAIALLSNYAKAPLDRPSPDWLGHHSDRERVRNSGLWNQNHVDEVCDSAFLDTLDEIVSGVRDVA